MRKLAVLLVLGSASAAFGFDKGEGEVRWDGISGVVTAVSAMVSQSRRAPSKSRTTVRSQASRNTKIHGSFPFIRNAFGVIVTRSSPRHRRWLTGSRGNRGLLHRSVTRARSPSC